MPDPKGNLVTSVGFDKDGYPRAGNLPFTYRDVYQEQVENSNTDLGTNYLDGSSVPADELWVVTTVCMFNADTAVGLVYLLLRTDGTEITVLQEKDPAANQGVHFRGRLYLSEGQSLRASFAGCGAGDYIYFGVTGHEMGL